jgi:hypothetical protein
MAYEYIWAMSAEGGGRPTARPRELQTGPLPELHRVLAAGDRALQTDGDLVASRAIFERAYQLAELAGDASAMATAALGLSGLWVSERRTVTAAALLEARLQHVLSMLDPRSVLGLRVRARLAAEADYRHGEHAAVLAVLDEVRAAGDPVALAEALSLAHHCLLGPGDVFIRAALARELIKASFRTRRRSDHLVGLMWQTVDAYSAGDPHAGRLLGELRDALGEADHPAVSFVVSAVDVMLAIRAGRLDDAESLTASCAKSGAAAGDIDAEWWPGAQLVTIRWYQERLPELLPLLSRSVDSQTLSDVDNSAIAALAVAAALAGDRLTAASCLATLCGRDLGDLPHSSSWLATMNGIVEAAHLIGATDVAASAYRLLLPYARLPMVGGPSITCFGSTQQALGVASLTLRDADKAVDHLREAVQHNLALGHWPAVVWSRRRLAEALRSRGQAADQDAARRELKAAAAEAAALGLPVPGGNREADSAAVTCEREGRGWRLTLRDDTAVDHSAVVEDSIGMLHLAVLIANPRQEIPAAELASGLTLLHTGPADGTGQSLLDRQAVTQYLRRIRQLDAEIEALPHASDTGQAAALHSERAWITAQLTSAAGLGGRARAFPADSERARVAVGKAIRRALTRITDANDRIGEHLQRSVHTGTRCSYWPG